MGPMAQAWGGGGGGVGRGLGRSSLPNLAHLSQFSTEIEILMYRSNRGIQNLDQNLSLKKISLKLLPI